jgi:hypothetical protein
MHVPEKGFYAPEALGSARKPASPSSADCNVASLQTLANQVF